MTVVQETTTWNVEQAERDLSKGIAKMVADAKAALKAGTPLAQVSGVASAVFADLLPTLKDIPSIEGELKEDAEAQVNTVILFGKDLYAAIKS